MERHLVAVSPHSSAESVLRLMKDANIDLVPVVEDGMLVGIVDENDVSDAGAQHVGEIMEKPLFVEENSSVDDAVKFLIKQGLSRIPVVDSKVMMHCIGIVCSSDLLREKKHE